MKVYALTIAAAALLAIAAPAEADIIAAKARTGPFQLPDGVVAPMPLDDKGNTSMQFTTTKKGIVVITYNAECAATGAAGDWVGLDIRVDGKVINPKAGLDDFAFCSATGATEIYTAVSRQGFVKLGAGEHTVQVVVAKQGVDSARIDDGSLVIEE